MKTVFVALSVILLLAGPALPAQVTAHSFNVKIVSQEVEADMKTFKEEQLKKIKENEESITVLKRKRAGTKDKVDDAYDKRILKLEQSNAELKRRITTYNDPDKSKWEEFKREFSHDMDELGQALKDMFRDNSN
jgi:cell division protein FtsB